MPDTRAPGPLTSRAVAGIGWSAVRTVGTVLLRITTLAILARLLTREDFGLVAAALVAVELSTLVAESGLGAAVVQARRMEARDIRVAFTVGLLTAATACGALIALADVVEDLMGIAGVAPVVRVIAVTFLIRALTLGQFLLARRLAFRRLSMIELSAYLGQGVTAVALALAGRGVWAIVGGHIAYSCLKTVLLWIACPHPMAPLLERSRIRALASYGGGLTLGRIVSFVARQGDYVIVGRALGAGALGLYKQAYQLMAMPAELFGKAVSETLFPAMATVRDDVPRLRRAYSRGATLLALLTLPTSAVAAALGDQTILVVLGPRWTEVGTAFSVMAFGIFFRTATKLSDSLVHATGAVYRGAWRHAVYAVMVLLGAWLGARRGLAAVALGVLLALVVNFLLMADLSRRQTDLPWRRFAALHVPGLQLAAVMGGAAWGGAAALEAIGVPALAVWGLSLLTSALAALALLRGAGRVPGTGGLAGAIGDVHDLLPGRAGAVLSRLLPAPRHPDRTPT